jgi:hypothetical protein
MTLQRNPIVYTELTQHLILFAKHWYGRTGNAVDDLATFMHKWSGVDKDVYNDVEIMRVLSSVFAECASKQMVEEFIRGVAVPWTRFVNKSEPMSLQEMIESMLGLIATLQTKENDGFGGMYDLIELPKPNQKYMVIPNEKC